MANQKKEDNSNNRKNEILAYKTPLFNSKNIQSFGIYNGDIGKLNYINGNNNIDLLILPIDKLLNSHNENLKFMSENKNPNVSYYDFVSSYKMVLTSINVREKWNDFQKHSKSNFFKYLKKLVKETTKELPQGIIQGIVFFEFSYLEENLGIPGCVQLLADMTSFFQSMVKLIDIDNLDLFNKVKTFINGIVLKNSVFFEDGTQKTSLDAVTIDYSDFLQKLKNEITIRSDFVVLDIEIIPVRQKHHEEYIRDRYYIKWLNGFGFKGYTCNNKNFLDLKELKPLDYRTVDDDSVFEFINDGVIKDTHLIMEECTLHVDWRNFKITPDIWKKTMHLIKFPKFIRKRIPSVYKTTEIDFHSAIYEKKPPPKPISISEILQSVQNEGEEDEFHDLVPDILDHINKTANSPILSKSPSVKFNVPSKSKTKTKSSSLTYFGTSYGKTRKIDVENSILEVMYELLKKKLLSHVRTSIDVPSNNFSAQFEILMKTLDSIIKKPSKSAKYLLKILRNYNPLKILLNLRDGLAKNTIRVYTATSNAFLLKESFDLPYNPVWGLAGEDKSEPNVLLIFISETIPNILEAVIHIYTKHVVGYDTKICTILESLVNAQEVDDLLPIPERMIWQLNNSSYSEKLSYIQNTKGTIKDIQKNKNLSTDQINYLASLSDYIKCYSEYLLIEKQRYLDYLLQCAQTGYQPTKTNNLEEEFCRIVGWATLDPEGLNTLKIFSTCLTEAITGTQVKINSPYTACIVYLFSCFWKACRRIAWLELFSSLVAMNPCFLPESDQVAVSLEMTTTQANLNFLFDLTSHQLSHPMHKLLRERAKNIPIFKKEADEIINEELNEHSARVLANAFLFVYPVIIDLAFSKFLGSGIFFTDRMDEEARKCLNYVFLILFPIVGGIINSIARTCTYYFFQKSIPLMLSSFIRRLSLSIIVYVASAFILSLVLFITQNFKWYVFVLSFLYGVSFCLYMTFFSILASIKDSTQLIFTSRGPASALKGVCIMIVPMCIASFAFNDTSYSIIVWAIYSVGLTISWLFMAYEYISIARDYMDWPFSLNVPSETDIQNLFEKTYPKPLPFLNEEHELYEKRIRLWERAAREYYMNTVIKALSSKNNNKLPTIIYKREKQQKWESELMQWFLQRTGTYPPPAKYSTEWDTMLKAAINELKKKYQVEKLNRGDLLFEFENTVIVFGVLYFIFIFIDKWVWLFSYGKPVLYIEGDGMSEYVTGTLFGTVFMLLCSGFLEISLSHLLDVHKDSSSQIRLGECDAEEMFVKFNNAKKKAYRKELFRFLLIMIAVFVFITGIYFIVVEITKISLSIYGMSVLGYVGFLVGLFHKLFFQTNESEVKLNYCLIGIILTCIIYSIVMSQIFGAQWYIVISTSMSGWLFAFSCIFLYLRETFSSVHYNVTLSPHLASSGQKYINEKKDSLAEKTLDTFVQTALTKGYEIINNSSRQKLIDIYTQCNKNLVELPNHHIIRSCVPYATTIINDIIRNLDDGHIKVHIVPEHDLFIAGHNYTATSVIDETGILHVFTFVPPTMGVVSDDLSQENLMWIGTAVLHEFCESACGYTHAESCVAEFLLSPLPNVLDTLPSRMLYQIKNSTKLQLSQLLMGTVSVNNIKGALGLNVDKFWPLLSQQSRNWFVRWAGNWEDALAAFKLKKKCKYNDYRFSDFLDSVPRDLMAIFRDVHKNSQITIRQIVAINVFSLFISRTIASHIVKQYKNPKASATSDSLKRVRRFSFAVRMNTLDPFRRNPTIKRGYTMRHSQTDKEVEKPPFSEVVRLKFEEFFLVFFMALTGDSRFGRELSATNIPNVIKLFFSNIYSITRRLVWILTKNFYLNHKTETTTLINSMSRGLFREQFFGRDGKLERVDSFNSALNTMVSILKHEGNTIIAERYNGPKPPNWRPTENDKPLSRGYFDASSNQLTHEFDLDNKGNVTQTRIYSYPDNTLFFPREGFVFEGMVDPNTKNLKDHENLIETRLFASNIASLTSMLYLKIKNEEGKIVDIHVSYVYELSDTASTHPVPKYASYQCPQDRWLMVTYFAAGWRIDNTTSGSSPKFSRVEFRRLDQQKQVYITEFDYSHPQHTRLNTILLNQETGMSIPISTPTEVAQDPLKLLPRLPPSSFYVYNELLTHDLKSRTTGFLSRQGRHKYIYAAPFGTTRGRQELWTYWRANKIEGVFARDVDEHLLRDEPVLKNYWKARDKGRKEEAQASLMEFKEILDVILVVSDNPTTRTNIHIKFSDLDALGTGGDGVRVGRQSISQDNEILPVMNLDSGTWPTGGGGVGSCRRDLIDYLSRIRWTAFVEIGSAEAVQRDYQIERNISSITYLPLWDVDFSSPDENIYRNLDFRTLRRKKIATKDNIINSVFVPMVYQLINAIADDELDSNKLTEYEELFVDMYMYFQKCDWVKSWNHASTQQTWISTWIECSKKRYKKKDTILLEMPTLKEIDMLFSLLTRLLLPLSATLPKIPVVHVSHHGIQAILGIISKAIHKSTLIVWDHGILWRERLFGLCTAEAMPRFVQMGLVGITRLVCRLVFVKADYVNPCTSIQNVDWEKWLGGGKYNDDKQKIDISRRIYPVVNGMNVARFKPKPELENRTPLAVMLSHVSPVKDIHNAIYAANVIVNQLHIQNYQLYIYGSKEKDAAYAAESENLISSLNLQGKVFLKGLGSPSDVLPAGWIFVNSSITEGLPLALGEAGLCGLPVVCTDVGGSREVISDLSSGVVYGAIAPPAKARQLALGELRVLTMSDGLEQLIDPNAPVVRLDDLLNEGPQAVERRMCLKDVREKRRKLGLQLRERTIQTFSIAKYWRQHEQVLWLGWLYTHKKSRSSFE